MSSEAEEEPGALFLNAKTAVPILNKFGEIEHLQLWTRIQTENKTEYGLINNKMVANTTKSIDMKFHWLQCKESQEPFRDF